MRRFVSTPRVWLVILLLASGTSLFAQEDPSVFTQTDLAPGLHPIYVGARVCGRCHSGPETGHQFSIWRSSKHARAFAALWSEDARRIATLSGITQEPQEAAACIGCHTTAWDVEPWEREETFLLEDGVQCERCHGPGSEYIDPKVMAKPEEAARRGLRKPQYRDCIMCHKPKQSHIRVLGSPEFDLETYKSRIAHFVPDEGWVPKGLRHERVIPPDDSRQRQEDGQSRYAGVARCLPCHEGPRMGYQFSRWRHSRHAVAFARLSSPDGYALAEKEGILGDPEESPECLRCHTTGAGRPREDFLAGFDFTDGVQCESCHGPASLHAQRTSAGTDGASLEWPSVNEETCRRCHEGGHTGPFDYAKAVEKIHHPSELPPRSEGPDYKTPLNLAVTPDGRELWVACEASGSVIILDLAGRRIEAELPVGGQVTDVTFTPDGIRAYVSCRLDDNVRVIDTARREVIETIPVGDEPHGLVVHEPTNTLYVLDTASDDISLVDLARSREFKRLSGGRRPWSLALSPDGSMIAAASALTDFVGFRKPLRAELTLIDTARGMVTKRVSVQGANLLKGVAWHPSGEFALFTHNRTKNLLPMTRLLQGWTITNGLGVLWRDGRVDQLLLDEPHICFPDPEDVAISPDGRLALVTSHGSDRVAVIDVEKLLELIQSSSDEERREVLPNHLGLAPRFVVKHIATRNSPRGVTFAPDGKLAYVANALDDSITVIDIDSLEAVDRIDLGGTKTISKVRFGERLFHSANVAFHRQFSCSTCHPDGHVDGITYDIEPDGIGLNPVDNRSLRGVLDTAPFKWSGLNKTLQRQCGPRLAVFFTRIDPFTPEQLDALTTYIATIPRPPNRFRPVGSKLTPAQRRGKVVFERTRSNDGRPLPEEKRCVYCHFPPLYTSREIHDVGTQFPDDTKSKFDVPHLTNIYAKAPYMHNGIAQTLEEIWTKYNHYDTHGVTNDLTKDQLNDLIEYLKTL